MLSCWTRSVLLHEVMNLSPYQPDVGQDGPITRPHSSDRDGWSRSGHMIQGVQSEPCPGISLPTADWGKRLPFPVWWQNQIPHRTQKPITHGVLPHQPHPMPWSPRPVSARISAQATHRCCSSGCDCSLLTGHLLRKPSSVGSPSHCPGLTAHARELQDPAFSLDRQQINPLHPAGNTKQTTGHHGILARGGT